MNLYRAAGLKHLGEWCIIMVGGNRTPDGILNPPLSFRLDENYTAKFKKITKKGNWLYETLEA